ncbi:hypothetical protein [Actinomycetospora sp. TBRC 11914]|uniref:hypothetical protein n=1 Tax=Actinomycetospora sp. TBRC 11914 TaxID=2729387 RepID=UPI00145D9977|nr:hypothetical protein [Actinomycetospora sp. TBRC 11914]NMO89009.1 hypothetical protein [Actinomycetospora sp. TBRC 11914]
MAAHSEGEKAVTPRQDPSWPEVDGGHPVTELMAPTQGASSPFGETEFPLPADQLDYQHPVTEINR